MNNLIQENEGIQILQQRKLKSRMIQIHSNETMNYTVMFEEKVNNPFAVYSFNMDNTLFAYSQQRRIIVLTSENGNQVVHQIIGLQRYKYGAITFQKQNNDIIALQDRQNLIFLCQNKKNIWQIINTIFLQNIERYILNNLDNEIIIAHSSYQLTVFQKINNDWILSQQLEQNNKRYQITALEYNKSQTHFLSKDQDGDIIIWEKDIVTNNWKQFQVLVVQISGDNICFIEDNVIAVQSIQTSNIIIYKKDQQSNQYKFLKFFDIITEQDYYPFKILYNSKIKSLFYNNGGETIFCKIDLDTITLQQIKIIAKLPHICKSGEISQDGQFFYYLAQS